MSGDPPTPLDCAALERMPLLNREGGDKDQHGQIMIIAGSRSVPGAALLAAHGAMRAGAGKLKIATVSSVAPQLAIAMPEAMVLGLAEADDGGFADEAIDELLEVADGADAIVAGPGLTTNKTGETLAAGLCGLGRSLALDAALLRALGDEHASSAHPPPVLLPHAGEMAALLNCSQEEIEADPLAAGQRAADRYGAVTLMKGVQSHVIAPDGRAWKYHGGGPGLGVSGSGDVLAGIVGGLLAQGTEPLTALLWGVWLHGEAGARLGRRVGPRGYLAREIPGEVPALLSDS
ncbi:MAG: NAD(P)H-hydrate dehydratase [Sphingomicrobium sp.]